MSGLVDFDTRLPGSTVRAEMIAEASGMSVEEVLAVTVCKEFPVLAEDEPAWPLAVESARAVLARTGVAPARIKFVIYTGSGHWDRPLWSPAAKAAHELGIERAHCFEVTNFCNSAMTAVQVAVDKVALGHGEYALVLLGDRLSKTVDYSDVDTQAIFNAGDCGAAILVSSTGYRFRHLGSSMRTDPSWADYFVGQVQPDGRTLFRRTVDRPGLSLAYVFNIMALIQEQLAKLGKSTSDIGHLVINQGDDEIHDKLMELLELRREQSLFLYQEQGHQGSADTVICLQRLLAEDRLTPGELILVVSSGMGFSWAVTALEYAGAPR